MIKYILIIKNYIRSIFKSKQQRLEEQRPTTNLLLGFNFDECPEIKRARKLVAQIEKRQQDNINI